MYLRKYSGKTKHNIGKTKEVCNNACMVCLFIKVVCVWHMHIYNVHSDFGGSIQVQ